MKFYVQYDDAGNITCTVFGETAPDCTRQLVFDDYQNTAGKIVADGILVDVGGP